jgi:hypothetical protein
VTFVEVQDRFSVRSDLFLATLSPQLPAVLAVVMVRPFLILVSTVVDRVEQELEEHWI